MLLNAVGKLSPREKKIMKLRFGLESTKEHTQRKWQTSWVSPNSPFPAWKNALSTA